MTTAVAAILLSIAGSACFSVDRAEFVYVTQFGKPVGSYDGARDAGLHFKLPWPVQSVQRLDRACVALSGGQTKQAAGQ